MWRMQSDKKILDIHKDTANYHHLNDMPEGQSKRFRGDAPPIFFSFFCAYIVVGGETLRLCGMLTAANTDNWGLASQGIV